MTRKQYKFVVVGDGACGKTSLIVAQAGGEFNDEYTPTAFDDYAIEALVSGRTRVLTVCDTAGEDDHNRLRPLSYPDADIFLVCYSVDQPDSLNSIQEKWVPEIRRFCPDTPVLIVGNKKDIRNESQRKLSSPSTAANDNNINEEPKLVSFEKANACAKELTSYRAIECSAKTKEGVRNVFDTAIRLATAYRASRSNRVLSSIMKLKLVF